MILSLKARSEVESLRGFHPGLPDKTLPELQEALRCNRVDKLSFNESPYGASPRAIAAIQKAAVNVHHYHDAEGKAVKAKLAALYGISPDMIYLGSGADEVVTLLMQGYLRTGEEVVMQSPTFGQYASATILGGGKPVRVPVKPDLTTDFAAMLAAITDATKMIFICNPNNPTGLSAGQNELLHFLRQVPSHVLVVLDEAYAEFVSCPDYLSGISLLAEFSNIVVIRTFSKVYGLAGLRLGYGIGRSETVIVPERIRNPFNVNSLALVAAEAALDDTDFRDHCIAENRQERERLTQAFSDFGFTVYPSDTNFLFVDTHMDSAVLCRGLADQGIIIRPGTGWDRPTFVRISIGNRQQNDRLLTAVAEYSRSIV